MVKRKGRQPAKKSSGLDGIPSVGASSTEPLGLQGSPSSTTEKATLKLATSSQSLKESFTKRIKLSGMSSKDPSVSKVEKTWKFHVQLFIR